jgi:hypothetical protein
LVAKFHDYLNAHKREIIQAINLDSDVEEEGEQDSPEPGQFFFDGAVENGWDRFAQTLGGNPCLRG